MPIDQVDTVVPTLAVAAVVAHITRAIMQGVMVAQVLLQLNM
jgi:hypothetical protein